MSTLRRKKYHHGNLRQTILDLARRRIEEGGPDSLSLRALAQEAGVSPMAPYRHFADHKELMASLASMGFAELRTKMMRFDSPEPRVALPGFAAAYVEYALKQPAMFQLMYGSGIPTDPSGQEEEESSVLGLINSRLAQLFTPEQIAEARLAGWAMIHGLASLVSQGRLRTSSKNVSLTARRMIEIVLNGMLPTTDRPFLK